MVCEDRKGHKNPNSPGKAECVMRAIVYISAGGPEVLHLVDRPTPEPGPGQVRVRIQVSGVNPTDWKRRTNGLPPGFAE